MNTELAKKRLATIDKLIDMQKEIVKSAEQLFIESDNVQEEIEALKYLELQQEVAQRLFERRNKFVYFIVLQNKKLMFNHNLN
jgi:hypothetical protein